MSIFTGKGKSIKEELEKRKQELEEGQLDYKKLKINKDLKKEGDSVRVRVLTSEDYTTYEAHGSYDKGIFTTPCIDPFHTGEQRCLMCEAAQHEEFKELKTTTRFLFAFYDIDLEMLRYLDVSYGQGGKLIDDIEDYTDNLDEYAFTLKRQGEGTKTSFKLAPILKLKGDDKEKFDKAGDIVINDDFYEKALYVKDTNQQAIELENKGFDVQSKLGYLIQDDTGKDTDPTKTF